jgi:hypothetical protein
MHARVGRANMMQGKIPEKKPYRCRFCNNKFFKKPKTAKSICTTHLDFNNFLNGYRWMETVKQPKYKIIGIEESNGDVTLTMQSHAAMQPCTYRGRSLVSAITCQKKNDNITYKRF